MKREFIKLLLLQGRKQGWQYWKWGWNTRQAHETQRERSQLTVSEQLVFWLIQRVMVRYKNTTDTGTFLESVQSWSLVENVVSHVDHRDIISLFHGLCLNVYMSCLYVISVGWLWSYFDKMGSGCARCRVSWKCQRQFETCESKLVGGYRETLEKKKMYIKGLAIACLLLIEH